MRTYISRKADAVPWALAIAGRSGPRGQRRAPRQDDFGTVLGPEAADIEADIQDISTICLWIMGRGATARRPRRCSGPSHLATRSAAPTPPAVATRSRFRTHAAADAPKEIVYQILGSLQLSQRIFGSTGSRRCWRSPRRRTATLGDTHRWDESAGGRYQRLRFVRPQHLTIGRCTASITSACVA
jgi:hypothetical protein